jgi:hypothetical protein
MSVLHYIEETNPSEVRELLTTAHLFLQERLPPFAACAIKWRIPFYTLRRNFCYLNRHPDHITLGFPHGYRLSPLPGILLGENENLKRVRYLEIRSIEVCIRRRRAKFYTRRLCLMRRWRKTSANFTGKTNDAFGKKSPG